MGKAITVVLSGGGVRGLAHIGVLKILEKEGYDIRRIVGTSSGALVGAMYASCLDASALERYAASLSFRKLLGIVFSHKDVSSGRGVERIITGFTDVKRFEDLKIPLTVNATDLRTGEELVFKRGSLLPALHASSAFPGVVAPVELDGRLLTDGGINETIALHLAPKALPVVVSDVTGGAKIVKRPSRIHVMNQAMHLLIQNNVVRALKRSDRNFLRVQPDVLEWELFSLRKAPLLIQRGEEAMQSSLPRLKRLLLNH